MGGVVVFCLLLIPPLLSAMILGLAVGLTSKACPACLTLVDRRARRCGACHERLA